MGKYLDMAKKLEAEKPRTNRDWLSAWRELAQITYGITAEDPRFERVMRWLNVCDEAFRLDSWPAFCEAADEVKCLVQRRT